MKCDTSAGGDEGLLLALNTPGVPHSGEVVEFGFGSGRNARECARRGYNVAAYEVAPWHLDKMMACVSAEGLRVDICYQDVLRLDLTDLRLSVAMIGTAIYWPKSVVYDYFAKIWRSLIAGGIAHFEFATPEDGSYQSDFCVYTCFPFPEDGYVNSFGHSCGFYDSCSCWYDHPGVIGASFWTEDEVVALLNSLGCYRPVLIRNDKWIQEECADGTSLPRSFIRATVLKL